MTSTTSTTDASGGRSRPTSTATSTATSAATPPAPNTTRPRHPRVPGPPVTPQVPACRWVSAAYAGAFLGVSKMSIYRLIHSGQLPHTTVNGHFRVPLSALQAHAATHRGPDDGSDRHGPGVTPLRPRTTPRASAG